MRSFERTHPWLKFSANLSSAPASFWILLGECQSKCAHIAGVPLRPATAQRMHEIYLAKGALATTAIEGNTLSEEEVLQHLKGKLKLPPSREYLTLEIDNIIEACNQLLGHVTSNRKIALDSDLIKKLNRSVLRGLILEEGIVPGQIRKLEVGVARYRAAPAADCEHLLDRLCGWLDGSDFEAQPGMKISYAILKAVLAHLYLAWIHPFGDGNGRTARLVEFHILISSGVPAPAAHLLSNHYNLTRSEYYRQLDQASRSGGNVLPFLTYAIQGFLEGLQLQIDTIREQQWDIAWRNYVHETFEHRKSATAVRQRHLILDLSRQSEPVPLQKLTQISPRVAADYAGRTLKTVSRDINAILKTGLITREKAGFRARRELILAFLPPRIER